MATAGSRLTSTKSGWLGGFGGPRRGETAYAIAVSAPTILWLGWCVATSPALFLESWAQSITWVASLIALNLADLGNPYGLKLAPDIPAAAAAAVLLDPRLVGLIVFVGSWDSRELRGQIRPARAVFNRSQLAIAASVASVASHAVPAGSRPSSLGVQAITAVAVMVGLNCMFVGTMSSVIRMSPPREAFAAMRLGSRRDFLVTWAAWAVMSWLLCAAYETVGVVAVLGFCVPAILGRQVLARSQQLARSEADAEAQQTVVRELAVRVAAERRDERVRIASDLHDVVLQPLYRVSLLCSVVRADLSDGKLLSLEQDVPALEAACSQAAQTLRQAIGNLRASPVGLGGLAESVRGLARDLQGHSQATIIASVGYIGKPSELVQLAAYQVLKEALLNAIYHSKGGRIRVELMADESFLRLSVEDDGIGFDPQLRPSDHFGLAIMRERAEAVGGVAYVDTAPGEGTIVAARFPLTPAG